MPSILAVPSFPTSAMRRRKTGWRTIRIISLYAYRVEVLKEITALPQSSLEIAESLEQLRWLENGYTIKAGITDVETIGIDTPQDLERAEEFLKSHGL